MNFESGDVGTKVTQTSEEIISIGAQLAGLIMFMAIETYSVTALPWKNLVKKYWS